MSLTGSDLKKKFNLAIWGFCLKLRLTLQGIWLQMKHSCWHQNWQVRNICALSVSWQIGHCGDREGEGREESSPAETNSSLSCSVMAEWKDGGGYAGWLEGVSQTTEQKEKQSHLTSWSRLPLKFRSRHKPGLKCARSSCGKVRSPTCCWRGMT